MYMYCRYIVYKLKIDFSKLYSICIYTCSIYTCTYVHAYVQTTEVLLSNYAPTCISTHLSQKGYGYVNHPS